jgi:hypothetical protein
VNADRASACGWLQVCGMRGRPLTAALPAIVRPVDADQDSAG